MIELNADLRVCLESSVPISTYDYHRRELQDRSLEQPWNIDQVVESTLDEIKETQKLLGDVGSTPATRAGVWERAVYHKQLLQELWDAYAYRGHIDGYNAYNNEARKHGIEDKKLTNERAMDVRWALNQRRQNWRGLGLPRGGRFQLPQSG